MILQTLRSILFYAVFFIHTIPLAIFVGLLSRLAPQRQSIGLAVANYWMGATLFFLRWIVGIRTHVEGHAHIPAGGAIIASKHMSDWDIFALWTNLDGKPAFIAKRELLDIPLFGWAAAWMNTVPVDRKRGREAFTTMMAATREKLDEGSRVVIFPEGTRKAPLEDPAYRSGLARMYATLDVPVVPVALTSGLYWGRNSLTLWPGTARARFLPAIPAGLDADTFQKTLIATIEAETDRMILEDVRAGLARPISPRMRTRLRTLEERYPEPGSEDI